MEQKKNEDESRRDTLGIFDRKKDSANGLLIMGLMSEVTAGLIFTIFYVMVRDSRMTSMEILRELVSFPYVGGLIFFVFGIIFFVKYKKKIQIVED